MKNSLNLILVAAVALATSAFDLNHEAHAFSSTGKTYRVLFSQATLSSSAYTELESSTAKSVTGFTYFSTAVNPIVLAAGAAGSEVDQFTIPQGSIASFPGNGVPGSPPGTYTDLHYVPLTFAATRRLAIKAKNSGNTTQELQINLIYGN